MTTIQLPLIGASISRKDGQTKVRGAAHYAADRVPDGLAYGVFATSSIPHGRIVGFENAQAHCAPGVIAVITYLDAPKLAPLQELAGQHYLPLQDDRVLYEGEPVALVVADTLERAIYAASLVRARIEPFDHCVEISDDPDRLSIVTEGYAEPDTRTGDPDAALHAADVRIGARYTTAFRHHVTMEPSATVASWSGDELTLWDATQHVWGARSVVARAFSVPPENVRVIAHYTGGGFGCKGYVWPHVILTALAARVVDRPVKLVLTRAQTFAAHGYQSATIQDVEVGAMCDGTLAAIKHNVVYATPLAEDFPEYAAAGTRALYACPAIATSHRVARIALQMPTAMRAPNEGIGSVALESAMDELAERLAMDPLELRLRNYAEHDPTSGKPFSSKKLREAYALAADRFGWSRRDPQPRSMRDGDDLIGYGMASCLMETYRNPSTAEVAIRADGSVIVRAGAQEIGTGVRTIMPQIAAEVLQTEPDRVTMELGDTTLPEAGPTYGSSSTMGVGSAVADAAHRLREKLKGEGAWSTAAFAEAAQRAGGEIAARGSFTPENSEYAMYGFGAVFIEVRVDADFGIVRVRRCVGAYSAGRIINRKTAASQITGGMIWGIGQALLENSETDARLGRFLSKNLAGYLVPVNADIEQLEAHFVEEYDPYASAIGVRGIGELAATGVAAAIANAVYHATGIRVRDFPIRPEHLIGPVR